MNRCGDCRKLDTDKCPIPNTTDEKHMACCVFELSEAEEADRMSLAGKPISGWCGNCPRGAACPTEVMPFVNLGPSKPPCRQLAETEHAEIKAWLRAEVMERLNKHLRDIKRDDAKPNYLGGINCKVDARVPDNTWGFPSGATVTFGGTSPRPILDGDGAEWAPQTLEDAWDAVAKEARGVFIARQKVHSSESINDVDIDDLIGVIRLKVARAKQEAKKGIPHEKDFIDSLIDLANYCHIIVLVLREWWNLPFTEGVTPADAEDEEDFWGGP